MNLELFVRRAHTAYAETLGYQQNLFNENSGGAILISSKAGAMAGGYTEDTFFAYVEGLIRRRDPAGSAPLALKQLANKKDNAIRLAFTTEQLDLSEHWWDWIGRDNALAAATFGEMLAAQTLQAYISRIMKVAQATIGANPLTFRDATTKTTDAAKRINQKNLVLTAELMGDASSNITTWLMPTQARTALLLNNLKNTENLFTFGTVNIMRDAEGRNIITTDDPSLREVNVADDSVFNWIYGLRRGAFIMRELDDFEELAGKSGGYENIKKAYQAQWSTLLNVYGYKYNTALIDAQGTYGSPSDAAIATPANWSQVTNNHKETAGVALRVVHDYDDE